MASYPIRTKARNAASQAEPEANDLFRFNILRDGPIIQNLGAGNDRVVIGSGPSSTSLPVDLDPLTTPFPGPVNRERGRPCSRGRRG